MVSGEVGTPRSAREIPLQRNRSCMYTGLRRAQVEVLSTELCIITSSTTKAGRYTATSVKSEECIIQRSVSYRDQTNLPTSMGIACTCHVRSTSVGRVGGRMMTLAIRCMAIACLGHVGGSSLYSDTTVRVPMNRLVHA